MTDGFTVIQRFVRETAGLALGDDKRYLVEDRLHSILRDRGLSSFDHLGNELAGHRNSELGRSIVDALTINETSFFRDRSLFAAFKTRLLPELIAARAQKRHLRIWSAGCSTGQEPYSVAMLVDERTHQLSGWRIEIVASDICARVVGIAQRGSFSQFEAQRGVPVTLLLRYFRRHGDLWQINEHLRAMIAFETRNLVAGFRDLGTFDVIFCRNVLMYFDAVTRQQVLGRLVDAIADDGCLVLGGAERMGKLTEALQADAEKPFVFRKRATARGAGNAAPCTGEART